MTLVTIDLSNVASGTTPVDKVVFWAPHLREGTTTAREEVTLVEGLGEVELKPGPVMVHIRAHGVADTGPRLVRVPDEGPVDLNDLLRQTFTYEPAVVSQVARDAADAAAAAARVEGVIDSTEWEGDQLRVLGELSPPLTGPAPELTISPGGTWVVDGVDTGHPAQGDKGDTPVLEVSAAGTWVIDGQDTGSPARGPEGYTPTVQGGTWHVGGVDTGYPASVGLVEDPNRPGLFIPETVDMSGAEVGVEDVAGLRAALDGKSDVGHKHPVTDLSTTGTRSASTYLRGDGTWTTPPDTKYSVPTQAEAQAGTATTGRVFSAQRVAQAIDHRAAPKDHSHTPQQVGAAPATHSHGMGQVTGLDTALDGKAPMPVEVTGDNWPTSGPPGTIYWQEEED